MEEKDVSYVKNGRVWLRRLFVSLWSFWTFPLYKPRYPPES
jgi:hypothetical protein